LIFELPIFSKQNSDRSPSFINHINLNVFSNSAAREMVRNYRVQWNSYQPVFTQSCIQVCNIFNWLGTNEIVIPLYCKVRMILLERERDI